MQSDLAAYIAVLGVEDVIKQVPSEGLMTGCLVRLEDALSEKQDESSKELLKLIRRREQVNGLKPYGDPELERITQECAHACLNYYNGNSRKRTQRQ